jgi:outer membrane biosynthesis protein TonB
MMTSLAIHIVVMLLMLLVASQTVLRSAPPEKPVDIVFYRPPEIEIPVPAVKLAMPRTAYPDAAGVGAPAPAAHPKANAPAGPDGPGKPDLPSGPEEGYRTETPPQPAQPKVGNTGILAFKDKIASLAQDKIAPRLGADAGYGAVDEVGQPSSRSTLMTNSPGSSGGINMASLNHSVGGGGGGAGGGGTGGGGRGGSGSGSGGGNGSGGGGMPVTRATSSINTIGGGDRPLSRGGAGPSRTDEEIQIVFDKYKSSFYRLYNRELRNDPTLKGQMVLRLTIEPDGSVSMCVLQSSDMKAPDLATQVVSRVKTINFGAKEGVPALTIVYPIDFLPAA